MSPHKQDHGNEQTKKGKSDEMKNEITPKSVMKFRNRLPSYELRELNYPIKTIITNKPELRYWRDIVFRIHTEFEEQGNPKMAYFSYNEVFISKLLILALLCH